MALTKGSNKAERTPAHIDLKWNATFSLSNMRQSLILREGWQLWSTLLQTVKNNYCRLVAMF